MDFDAIVKMLKSIPLLDISVPGLSLELSMLLYSVVLGLLQLFIAARAVNSQRGLAWNLGARDGEPAKVSAVAGRLDRAYRNFMETFPFFVAAVLIAHVTARYSWATALGTQMYFGARVIYWPLYAFGVPGVRTMVWLVSMIGLILVLSSSFFMPA